MMLEKIPTEKEMGTRMFKHWKEWRMYKDIYRKKCDPNYEFSKLPEEQKIKEYMEFSKGYILGAF